MRKIGENKIMKKLMFLMMLFGLMIFITDGVSAQNTCSKKSDGKQVNVEFANATGKPFTIHPVDQNCKESKSIQQLPPSQIYKSTSFSGYVFRIREVGTNRLLQEVVVNPALPNMLIQTDLDDSDARTIYIPADDKPQNQPSPQTTGGQQQQQQQVVTKPLATGGFTLKKGEKYFSPSGNHYLILQERGNLVIYTKNDGYIWGLDQMKKNFADRVEFGKDGVLAAYDAKGKVIWSPPQAKRDPSAKLNMTFNGALQVVDGNGEILWSSDGNLSPIINVFTIKPNLKPCAPEAGWAKCVELVDPAIQIIATQAVSQSAINGVANIYPEMAKRFGAKYPKSQFNGFKVYMTNTEPWSALRNLSAINFRPEKPYETSDDFYRGFGGPDKLLITEQMICKQGVKTRNDTGIIRDNDVRTLDQVIHEFAHSIDFKYISDQTLNTFRESGADPIEQFAFRVQNWFGAPSNNIPANQEAVLKNLFTSRATFSCEGYKP